MREQSSYFVCIPLLFFVMTCPFSADAINDHLAMFQKNDSSYYSTYHP